MQSGLRHVVVGVALYLMSAPCHALPFELASNGSFETGTLSGWVVGFTGSPAPSPIGNCASLGRNWNVAPSATATGCLFPGNPIDGTQAAYVMNDSGGIGFTPSTYILSQDLSLPSGLTSAILSWSDTSISSYGGQSRQFLVEFYQGATLLGNVFTYNVPFSDFSIGWDARTFDVTSLLAPYGGSAVQLRFSNYIPQSWTGPAGLGLDAVSLQVEAEAVPEPTTLALLGAGLVALRARRRRTS